VAEESPAYQSRAEGGLWDRLLSAAHDKSSWLFCHLGTGRLQAQNESEVVIAFPANRPSVREEMESPEHRKPVQEILSELLGKPVRVRFVCETEQQAEQPGRNADIQDEIVREALDIFGGRIA